MRRIPSALLAPLATALVLVVMVPGGPAGALPAAPVGAGIQDDPGGAARLFELINADRAAAGLAPVRLQGDLTRIAAAHSQRMAAAGSIWHNDGLFTTAVKQLVGARSLGENVAFESGGMTRAHWMLMQSPGHRGNIMNPTFDAVGIAVAVTGDGIAYLTEAFAQTGGAAPAPAPRPAPAPAPPAPPPAPPAPPAPPTPVAPPTTAAPTATAPPPAAVAAPASDAVPTTATSTVDDDEQALEASPLRVAVATATSSGRSSASTEVPLAALALMALANVWLARWVVRSGRILRATAPTGANARPR